MKIKIAKAKTIKTKTIKTKTIYMSIFLVFLITAQTLAAVPQATYDETLYINLDHYGTTTKTSIVKSYSLNGNTQITDYGNYDDVINMTDYTPFEKYEQNVVFDFSKSASLPKRFCPIHKRSGVMCVFFPNTSKVTCLWRLCSGLQSPL